MAEMSALQARAHEPIACVPEMARGEIFLARGIHCSHNFFCPTSVSILWRVCLYIHIFYCIEIVYELPLLSYNTARETFLQKPRTVQSVDWIFIFGAQAWLRLGKYVTLDKKFYSLLAKQKVAAAPIYFHIFFLTAFLEEAFIRNVIIIVE